MKLWWGGHDLNWFHHTLCTIQLSGVSWNCNRTGLFDDSQVYWMFLGKKQYPNPVKPLFGTRQNLWSSTLVHDFPTFLYLFWVDELFWRRKKTHVLDEHPQLPSHPSHFARFFSRSATPVRKAWSSAAPRWTLWASRIRRSGAWPRRRAEDSASKLRNGSFTAPWSAEGLWERNGWLDDFGGYNEWWSWSYGGYVHRFFLDMNVATVVIYGDIKWLIDGIWTKNHKQNMTGWCWWETFPSKWFFNQQKWNQHCDKTARHGYVIGLVGHFECNTIHLVDNFDPFRPIPISVACVWTVDICWTWIGLDCWWGAPFSEAFKCTLVWMLASSYAVFSTLMASANDSFESKHPGYGNSQLFVTESINMPRAQATCDVSLQVIESWYSLLITSAFH